MVNGDNPAEVQNILSTDNNATVRQR